MQMRLLQATGVAGMVVIRAKRIDTRHPR